MVNVKLVLAACAVAIDAASASPLTLKRETCTTKTQRKAWHMLANDEKKAYLDAELCLMNTPSTLNLTGAENKFDELQSIHHKQSYILHNVGAFLPFHRLFVHAHEVQLRTVCGYKGTIPYWNQTHDVGKFTTSGVLDPVFGFGGTGNGTKMCIIDGPFANYTSHLGPGYKVTDHCIYRNVNDGASMMAAQDRIDRCMNSTDFLTFWPCIEGGPHGAGHGGIGGLMVDPIASPGDPLFYLHHTWLDKLWEQWQAKDPSPDRMAFIAGPNKPSRNGPGGFGPPGGFPGFPGAGGPGAGGPGAGGPGAGGPGAGAPGAGAPGAGGPGGGAGGGAGGGFPGGGFPGFPGGGAGGGAGGPGAGGGFPGFPGAMPGMDMEAMQPPQALVDAKVAGDAGNETTLSHVLSMYGVIPDATIADVMDVKGGLLCYEYL